MKLKCPYKLNKASQIGPLLGVYDTGVVQNAAIAEATSVAAGVAAQADGALRVRGAYGYRPLFAFSSGNAVMNACESKSISINGATWSELNGNLYNRSLDRCYVPDDEAQKAWSTCGGKPNAADSVPISGHCLVIPDCLGFTGRDHGIANGGADDEASFLMDQNGAGVDNAITMGYRPTEGSSMDSGLCRRMHNFYDQIVGAKDRAAGAANADATQRHYTIEVTFPIQGSCFNDLWGAQGLARSDPRNRMALGLPHINSGQIVLQFKDLAKTLFRRHGRPNRAGAVMFWPRR